MGYHHRFECAEFLPSSKYVKMAEKNESKVFPILTGEGLKYKLGQPGETNGVI